MTNYELRRPENKIVPLLDRDDQTRTSPHGDPLFGHQLLEGRYVVERHRHPLPSHIERAARVAYMAGYGDRLACNPINSGHGVEVFLESMQHDADEARRST